MSLTEEGGESPRSEETPPWYYGCLFTCPLPGCSSQFFEEIFLVSHLEVQHCRQDSSALLAQHRDTHCLVR